MKNSLEDHAINLITDLLFPGLWAAAKVWRWRVRHELATMSDHEWFCAQCIDPAKFEHPRDIMAALRTAKDVALLKESKGEAPSPETAEAIRKLRAGMGQDFRPGMFCRKQAC